MTASIPSKDELQQSMRKLHAELTANPSVDARSRRLMQQVLADIERLLHERSAPQARAQPGVPADPAVETAPRRLRELAVEFEARHPLLAGNVRQFVDLLGRAGL